MSPALTARNAPAPELFFFAGGATVTARGAKRRTARCTRASCAISPIDMAAPITLPTVCSTPSPSLTQAGSDIGVEAGAHPGYNFLLSQGPQLTASCRGNRPSVLQHDLLIRPQFPGAVAQFLQFFPLAS